MNPETIQFHCDFCRTVLTVPAHMAGISGPCPHCGQTITSPQQSAPSVNAVAAPQWPQAPAIPPAQSPTWPPPVSSTPASVAGSIPDGGMTGSGLPPKRAPGQPPLTASLGSNSPPQWGTPASPASPVPGPLSMPVGSSGSPPNQSRLIPGAPVLPNMTHGSNSPAHAGAMSPLPGTSLLGREVSGAPVSPATHHLHAPGAPSLSLGSANAHPSAPVSPLPASTARNIAELRTPRGTNFIRLAFAALFMLGFLGLVGFLLKDYLPGMLNGIIARDDTEETTPVLEPAAPKIPAPPVVSGSSVTDSAPKQQGTAEKTTVPLVTESTRPAALPKTAGFDPTEPVAESPLKADATAAGTPPQPPVTTALPQEMTATRTAIVEETAAPGSIPQEQAPTTPEIAEDSPAEAAPAIESLKKFLSAGSLNERLKHTLGAEHMQPLMERYYKHSADGPVRVDRIQFIRMDPNPELGAGRHCIFSLENKTWEFPVPVMLEEQKDGFKVDWLAFVEFKDRMLEKFLQAYQEGPPARFHVGIIRHHYFEDNVPSLDRKDAFRISPAPPNTFHAYAFLDKESPLAQELRARLPWETHVWAIVELEWKKLGSQQWVEVSAMPQMHWYSLPVASKPLPAAPKPKPISTTQKFAEPEEEMPPGISKNGKGSGKSSGKNTPPPGISKSTPDLPTTIRRPLPAGR